MSVRKRKTKKTKFVPRFELLIAVFLLFLVLILCFKKKLFTNQDKFSVVTSPGKGNVGVLIFDSKNNKLSKLLIPENTSVDVSGGYGYWKIAKVWDLGFNEKKEGQLLADTILKNFKIPIAAWADSGYLEVYDGSLVGQIKQLFNFGKTNLNFGDRFKIFRFSIKLGNHNREEIDLRESGLLKKQKTKDGEEEYVLTNNFPNKLIILASEDLFVKNNLSVLLIDKARDEELIKEVSDIIKILGGKVTLVKREKPEDLDCTVAGEEKFVKKLAPIFRCEKEDYSVEGNFDIHMTIGENFKKRF